MLNVTTESSRNHIWEIGPSETLVVRTKEKVKMPNDLCGTYTPLHRHASDGLMLLNASLVEPGYEGLLSCFLLNFSSERISLEPGGAIAKIAFYQLTGPPTDLKPLVIGDAQYEAELAKSAKKFHKSFMDITGVEDRAVERARNAVKNWVVVGGVLVALLLLWASLEPVFSKFIYDRTGIYTNTQRIEDTKLLKDLQVETYKAENERLKSKLTEQDSGNK